MKTNGSISLSSILRHQVHQYRTRNVLRLRFPDDLEIRFEADVSVSRSRRLATVSLVFIFIYNLFLISDRQLLPLEFKQALLLRTFVFTPLALGAYFLLKSNPRRSIRGLVVVTLTGVAALIMAYLYRNGDDVLVASVQVGLLIMLLLTNVVMRLRWAYAVACTFFSVATVAAFLWMNSTVPAIDKVHLCIMYGVGALIVLIATFSLEREERLSYLLWLSNELKTVQLATANEELELLSTRDGLTRLANRAAFDLRFEEMWAEAVAGRTPLSAVMIDIDHFKIVNDTQGHLYGDEVIKRVAALVQQGLRGKDDFAARYGGEEFVLLLPGTDQESAVLVAERIRSLVKLAGSPAPAQPVPEPGLWTTVSCGVATIESVAGIDRRRLLLAADTALYAAKAEGRNRVCTASAFGEEPRQPAKRKEDGADAA